MLKQIEGSKAIAETIAACHPQVISSYPISPQTHIVESLSALVKSGQLSGCEYLNVESEFAAMSACIGASAVGARTYTATASQGLLYMVEAVYNASGLGLPIVMTVANRAIGGPINIWNDHSDAISQRDCGWIQLFAQDNQEAADLHVQAYRIAEALSVPVMVCMDGFILTHAVEQVDVPEVDQVAQFLPSYQPQMKLDPASPITIGAMVGPEAFTEVKYLQHLKQYHALKLIPQVQKEFHQIFGRNSGGLIHSYRIDGAETVIVAMGSILGTLKDTVDLRRKAGEKIGVLGITAFRPFPFQQVGEILREVKRIVCVEKAFSLGIGGVLASHCREALSRIGVTLAAWDNTPDGKETTLTSGAAVSPIRDYEIVAGLGGRDITIASLQRVLDQVQTDKLGHLTFLDLKSELVYPRNPELAAVVSGNPVKHTIFPPGTQTEAKKAGKENDESDFFA